jgi:predicted O-methyltransferase YrrM
MKGTIINKKLAQMIEEENDISYFLPILYEVSKNIGKKTTDDFNIIELGVRSGCSTIAFLSALCELKKGRLWSCDIEKTDISFKNVTDAGLFNYWYFWEGDSIDFANFIGNKIISLIFIDTSHEFAQTTKEIEVWAPKLKIGGKIIFHDTCSRREGVAIPIKNFLKKNKTWEYYNIDISAGLGIMTKH